VSFEAGTNFEIHPTNTNRSQLEECQEPLEKVVQDERLKNLIRTERCSGNQFFSDKSFHFFFCLCFVFCRAPIFRTSSEAREQKMSDTPKGLWGPGVLTGYWPASTVSVGRHDPTEKKPVAENICYLSTL